MDVASARWLVSAAARPALAAAAEFADPASLAAAESLRRSCAPDQAAAALTQVALRRRARAKFGDRADRMFFTSDGLQQATRSVVARWRAARFAVAGVRTVVDVGCGLGADALAFADAGLEVIGVEADPVTAVFAQANIGDRGRIVCARAEDVAEGLLASALDVGVFIDPARRNARGRSWRLADLSPSWEFATALLRGRFGCLKAAPGLELSQVDDEAEANWVSESGDLVELSLWTDGTDNHGVRAAVLLPAGDRLDVDPSAEASTGAVGAWLYEPGPAVIRSGGVDTLAARLGAHRLAAGIAYLSAEAAADTPFATAFEVRDILPHDERALRAWVRANGVGTLELKTRGLGVDPAVLRRRLKPSGPASATLVLTPTPDGARALVVHRPLPLDGVGRQQHRWHSA